LPWRAAGTRRARRTSSRPRLFDLVGLFDETLTLGGDSDWFARAADMGASLDTLARVTLHKRIHDANLSADVARYRQELLTITRRSLLRRGVL
jgi:hypothetical protein